MNPWMVWGIIPALILVRELLRFRRLRQLDAELRRLRWRDTFAEIRNDTVRFVIRDKIKPASISAEMLYTGSSALVRHANDYDLFARGLFLHLLASNMPDEERTKRLAADLQESPEEVRNLVAKYFTSTIRLACERSWFVRILVRAYASRGNVRRRPPLANVRDKLTWMHRNPVYRSFADSRRIAYSSSKLKSLGAHC